MKLTTARLKKLIREELNKISEAADDFSQMGADMGFDYETAQERAKGFMGDTEYEQPISIMKNGDVRGLYFSTNGEDYDFMPKALNKEKLKDTPLKGKARTVGSMSLIVPQQNFKIAKDGKFSLKSKDGQLIALMIPADQMQEIL